ncbi:MULTISPECIES: HlyD family efflux transporter periplasmic adaptor subunit [unclassified Anabaena]|uniref:HlyD family efflux transporter periplasmic adaptor subunit n=1 Tax=unclassified Anabaena TaxID=2619674 RepID=UPI0039C6ADDF
MAVIIPLGLAAIGVPFYFVATQSNFRFQSTEQSDPIPAVPQTQPVNQVVVALGRIQTKDKIIQLSGPSILQTARVAQLQVKQGEQVSRGQVIAVLDILNQQRTAVEKAQQNVKVAQAQLNQVRAGTVKQGEIAAQQARIADLQAQFQGSVNTQKAQIARLEAEFKNAQTEYSRFQSLYEEGAISAVTNDSKRLAVETLQAQVDEAKANLNQISSSFPSQIKAAQAELAQLKEVRPVDVQVAQAELETALVSVAEAKANLDLAYVKAPVDGKVLKINSFPGETISENGIVQLGQTQEMFVIAEVYETDINKLKIGQKAAISSNALASVLTGKIEQISNQIGSRNILSSDPVLALDSRVVEVKIRLADEDIAQAANFINLQVDVRIETDSDKIAKNK